MTALRAKRPQDIEQGQFGKAVQEAMEKKGWTMQQLAEKIDSTYEHARKLIKSYSYPSKYMLKEVCKALDLDAKEMEHLVTADKLSSKYGDSAAEIYGTTARVEEIKRDVNNLSDQQFSMLKDMLRTIKRQNV